MNDSPYLIVGGGIAGLATSLGLSRSGRPVTVVEKAPTYAALGAGLQLGPNAVKALRHLGAWDAVEHHCTSPREIQVRDGMTGRRLQTISLHRNFEARFGAPYRVALRSDLHEALLEVARARSGIEIRTGTQVSVVDVADTRLTLDGNVTLQGAAIIGADGVRSIVRQQLNGEAGIADEQHVLFRRLLPMSEIPGSIAPDAVTLWLCPGGHVVHYGAGKDNRLNVVASITDARSTLEQTFKEVCLPLQDLLSVGGEWSVWPALAARRSEVWNSHKTVLVGDAAHASLPYLAQGAAMALEDAWVLSQCLERNREISSSFAEFSIKRRARTEMVQARSRQIGKVYHVGTPWRQARNVLLQLTTEKTFLDRLSWIYMWEGDGV